MRGESYDIAVKPLHPNRLLKFPSLIPTSEATRNLFSQSTDSVKKKISRCARNEAESEVRARFSTACQRCQRLRIQLECAPPHRRGATRARRSVRPSSFGLSVLREQRWVPLLRRKSKRSLRAVAAGATGRLSKRRSLQSDTTQRRVPRHRACRNSCLSSMPTATTLRRSGRSSGSSWMSWDWCCLREMPGRPCFWSCEHFKSPPTTSRNALRRSLYPSA